MSTSSKLSPQMTPKRFRILVIGRANAGKTTILQKLCNTTAEPMVLRQIDKKIQKPESSVLDSSLERGQHDIETQLVFCTHYGVPVNSFIFHDSRGFEAGGAGELKLVQQFIEKCSKARRLEEQVHAIWYCIPTSDDRPITVAEKKFFNECGTGLVIVLWTKTDSLDVAKFEQLRSEGYNKSDTKQQAPQKAWVDFEKNILPCFDEFKYPPKAHVAFRNMHKPGADCNDLIEKTAAALSDEKLQQFFLSIQQNNVELCIIYALKKVVNLTESGLLQYFKANDGDWGCFMGIVLDYFPCLVSVILDI